MSTRRFFATIAVLLLILVSGIALLYAVRAVVPPASASSTPTLALATIGIEPPATSPVPSAAVTPFGFVLPQGCSYVGAPLRDPFVVTEMTWEFNCAVPLPDLGAVQRLSPAFAQQGWSQCVSGPGRGVWAKGTTQTIVSQSAAGYPTLSQLPRQSQDCP